MREDINLATTIVNGHRYRFQFLFRIFDSLEEAKRELGEEEVLERVNCIERRKAAESRRHEIRKTFG